MGKTISLFFEDSPTTISFPDSSDEEVPCSKEKEVVKITSNEFCNGIVLLGMNLMQQTAVIITNGLNSFIRNTMEMAVRCYGKIQNIKFKKIELLAGTLVKPKGDNPNTDNSISVAKLLYFFEYLMI